MFIYTYVCVYVYKPDPGPGALAVTTLLPANLRECALLRDAQGGTWWTVFWSIL